MRRRSLGEVEWGISFGGWFVKVWLFVICVVVGLFMIIFDWVLMCFVWCFVFFDFM